MDIESFIDETGPHVIEEDDDEAIEGKSGGKCKDKGKDKGKRKGNRKEDNGNDNDKNKDDNGEIIKVRPTVASVEKLKKVT